MAAAVSIGFGAVFVPFFLTWVFWRAVDLFVTAAS
jgi:hypothetical protein